MNLNKTEISVVLTLAMFSVVALSSVSYTLGKINAQYEAVRAGHGRYVTNLYYTEKWVTNVNRVVVTNRHVEFKWNPTNDEIKKQHE